LKRQTEEKIKAIASRANRHHQRTNTMMKTASDAPCPAEDAVLGKLRQIADSLEQAAVASAKDSDDNNNNAQTAALPPLKVSVARPFKDDYQGYFVLTLKYRNSACQLTADDVLKCAGVDGTKLNAQIWSSSTFQLLIPKYQSDHDTVHKGQGFVNNSTGQWMNIKHQLMLIVFKLVLGISAVYFLSCIILHSPDIEGSGFVWRFTQWVKWLVASTVHLHQIPTFPSLW